MLLGADKIVRAPLLLASSKVTDSRSCARPSRSCLWRGSSVCGDGGEAVAEKRLRPEANADKLHEYEANGHSISASVRGFRRTISHPTTVARIGARGTSGDRDVGLPAMGRFERGGRRGARGKGSTPGDHRCGDGRERPSARGGEIAAGLRGSPQRGAFGDMR
jgi:hypothetical protein